VKPGGAVEVREVVWKSAPAANSRAPQLQALRAPEAVKRAMLYAGLAPSEPEMQPLRLAGINPAPLVAGFYPELARAGSAEAADALAALQAQLVPQLEVCTVRGSRPQHAAGASFSLKSRKSVAPKAEAPPPATDSAWASLGSADGGAGLLLDEDELLEEEDKAEKKAEQMDCGTSNGGKRKACKNCSCGLREMLENENEEGNAPPPKSACGNCGLGDAFRCEGCPYRGKPTFAPGEELKLADSSLKGDTIDTGDAKVLPGGGLAAGGVVKLSLDDTMDDVF